jgi:molecular chaperone GrpE
LEKQKDEVPAADSEMVDPDKTRPEVSAIPEEAEIIEIVDLNAAPRLPEPVPPLEPPQHVDSTFPKEALDQIRTLKGQLERKDKQIEQVMEAYRSKKTETEKLRDRIEKTERRRFEQSKGDFIARFVEVLDNLDRAIDSIEQSFDADSVLQGIMLVRSRLVQLLKTEGLEKIFVRGQPFDPMHSEAAEMEGVPDEEQDGVVLKELQPGYMLKGSLLRAARVVVGQFGAEIASSDGGAATLGRTHTIVDDGSDETPGSDIHDINDSNDSWETDASAPELEFSDDGLDFSND